MNTQEIDNYLFGQGVDSFNRFDAFLDIRNDCEGANYWYALINAYTMSDNLYQYRDDIKGVFLCGEDGKETMMDSEELEYYNSLPDVLTIYRGMTLEEYNSGDYGVSWTTDKDVAHFFAYQYARNQDTHGQEKTIITLTVKKSDIIAFLNGRNEYEVIYLHRR